MLPVVVCQVYSFARDGGLPYSKYMYNMNKELGCPLRAIWLCVVIAFILGLPGLINSSALSALFSLTATGLYSSYLIPILLRITVAKSTFKQAEFNLGLTLQCWVALLSCVSRKIQYPHGLGQCVLVFVHDHCAVLA